MAYSIIAPQVPPNAKGMPPRVPRASHRHAAPSGPWPWADLGEETPFEPRPSGESLNALDPNSWRGYPTSLFRNWTSLRLERSGIAKLLRERSGSESPPCVIYYVDVNDQGRFSKPSHHEVTLQNAKEFWSRIQAKRPDGTRLRAIFIENLSAPVMQTLGTKYSIEPFFFSSSLNWIPSRYQEDSPEEGTDHITIVLNFLRVIDDPTLTAPPITYNPIPNRVMSRAGTITVDAQAPLSLRSNEKIVLIDLLALHMIRHKDSSTIISYHPPPEWQSTSAEVLHTRFQFAGQSVYWRTIFSQSDDPTFVLLSLFWHALYAWDEALETLYTHICWLETKILITNDVYQTRELHVIRASLLHYTAMLEDFKKAVLFIQNTPTPTMRDHSDRERSIMDRECNVLVSEIERLEMFRKMQDMRLENLVNLAFNNVNFRDSQDMRSLTEATLRDSAVMKQISYLTMVFLPASFAASVFGMNTHNFSQDGLGSLVHYIVLASLLTGASIWILVALHSKHRHEDVDISFAARLQWPARKLVKWALAQRRTEQGKTKKPSNFKKPGELV